MSVVSCFFSPNIVSGSEDMAVHSLTCDSPDVTNVTKFLGHSAPVLDVCWNYDETLMASCDTKVRVSVLRACFLDYNYKIRVRGPTQRPSLGCFPQLLGRIQDFRVEVRDTGRRGGSPVGGVRGHLPPET